MRKYNRSCVIHFYKASKLKSPVEHYLRLLQLYISWREENELKQGSRSSEDRHKEIKGDIFV